MPNYVVCLLGFILTISVISPPMKRQAMLNFSAYNRSFLIIFWTVTVLACCCSMSCSFAKQVDWFTVILEVHCIYVVILAVRIRFRNNGGVQELG